MKKKTSILSVLSLFAVNFLIMYYTYGDAERYKSIKYLVPERGADIALSMLNIAVITYLLTNMVLNTIEVKESIIIRIGKKGFNRIILKEWIYLTFLLLICNACFEVYLYEKLFFSYLMLSYLILFFMLPVFLRFMSTDYYFILCMLSIFLSHVVFYIFI